MLSRIVRSCLCLGALATVSSAGVPLLGGPDLLYQSNLAPADIRIGAMAGAGCALPDGVLCMFVNPALIHAYAEAEKNKGLLIGASYAQDEPVYGGSVVSGGLGYYSQKTGTIGNVYRYLQGDRKGQTDYQAVGTYAGQLFQRSSNQGAVDYGINVRYEQSNWNTYDLPTLVTAGRDAAVHDSIVSSDASTWSPGNIVENRLMLDLGFFQADIFNGLDFGLVCRNLLGYAWRQESPTVQTVDSTRGSPSGDTVYVTGARYVGGTTTTNGWTDNWYRSLDVGIVFRTLLAKGKIAIRMPLDLEFIGIFDRSATHTMFRVGAEAEFMTRFAVRVGYARDPSRVTVPATSTGNINVFTGGLGLKIAGLRIDGYGGTDQWGLGASFNY